MSDFLENLKKSVDEDKFNSEIANKINEINKKADEVAKSKSISEMNESIKKRIDDNGNGEKKIVDSKMVDDSLTEYGEKMNIFKRENEINSIVVDAINLAESFKIAQGDLKSLIDNLTKEEYDNYKKITPDEFNLIETIINFKF